MLERPSLHALAVYLAVVERGTMTAAAEAEGLSQPAISAQVKALERYYGTRLMERNPRGVTLTPAGQIVAEQGRRILNLVSDLDRSLASLEGLQAGRLVIGASSTVGEQLLPEVLGQFRCRYPDIELQLSIGNSSQIVQSVKDRTFDLGIVGRVDPDPELVARPVFDDHLDIFVAPESPFAGRQGLSVADLMAETFILREQGSATRDLALHCLSRLDCRPRGVIEIGSNEAVKRAVSIGLGIGILSTHTTVVDQRAGMIEVLRCHDWDCRRSFWLIYCRDRLLSHAEIALMELL